MPEPQRAPQPAPGRRRTTGLGRVLVALYGVFAVAAVSRASVQIATRFHEAPLAYLLSAVAGVTGDPHNVVGISLPLLRLMFDELGFTWTDFWSSPST